LQLDEVSVELIELRRQHISVRDKVVLFAAELLLGLDEIEAESVFACDLVTHREVIYPLELVESLVQEGLAWTWWPEDIPLVRVRIAEVISFQKTADKFGVTIQQLVQHFEVVDMVGSVLLLLWRHIV
jgi:hypothetical protein